MSKTLQHYIDKQHVRYMPPELQEELKCLVPRCEGDAAEAMFWVINNLKDYPNCKACGTRLSSFHWEPFLKPALRESPDKKQGYRPYCGRSCSYKFGTKQETYKKTSLLKYGVEHPMQAPEVIAKVKATNIDKYGDANPMRWTGEKFLKLINEKYGTETVRHIDGVHNKIAETKYQKTVEYLPQKIRELEERFDVKCITPLDTVSFTKINNDAEFEWQHSCGRKWTSSISFRGIRQCPSCSSGTSKGEQAVMDFIKSLGIDVEHRNRSVIAPKEIDIWIPEHKIGIEFDGTYWHSAKFQNEKQSLEKLTMMEQAGGRLITLQEHLWVNKAEHVKNRLASILGRNVRIPGRKTEVREIDKEEARKFLGENHLQGYARSTVQLGLYHKNELVSVATFSKPRWAKKYDWELIRMAAKAGYMVQGGPSKLISEFRRKYQGTIISYADRCWSTGNVYNQLGFKFSHFTSPSYWWIHHMLGTYARYQTQKKKLPRLLGDLGKTFYPELSEEDNMRIAGFLPLYDRGNSAWILD